MMQCQLGSIKWWHSMHLHCKCGLFDYYYTLLHPLCLHHDRILECYSSICTVVQHSYLVYSWSHALNAEEYNPQGT